MVYEDDEEIFGAESDLIDTVRFTISPSPSISQTSIETTGRYGVGTIKISYTVYCSTGYCGDYCQFHCDKSKVTYVN